MLGSRTMQGTTIHGVSFESKRKSRQYRARLSYQGVIDLGRFETANEACMAYDQAVHMVSEVVGAPVKPTNFPKKVSYYNSDVHTRVQRHLQAMSLARDTAGSRQGAAATAPEDVLWLAYTQFAAGPAGPAHAEADPGMLLFPSEQQQQQHQAPVGHPWAGQPGGTSSPADELPPLVPAADTVQNSHSEGSGDSPDWGNLLSELLESEPIFPDSRAAGTSAAGLPPHAGQQLQPLGCLDGAPGWAGSGAATITTAHQHVATQQPLQQTCSLLTPDAAPLQQQQQQQQQQQALPVLLTAGEAVAFVDLTVAHLTRLYADLGQLAAVQQQHAGLVAVRWVAEVRSNILGAAATADGAAAAAAAVAPAQAAALHMCSSLVSLAASQGVSGCASGPFSSTFLAAVLEQLMQAMLCLRATCAAVSPAQRLSSTLLAGWRLQLKAPADPACSSAVATLLGCVGCCLQAIRS